MFKKKKKSCFLGYHKGIHVEMESNDGLVAGCTTFQNLDIWFVDLYLILCLWLCKY